jgi:serine/threonine protein kinase/tetratricopeptide (TPR) repeat protein
MESGPIDPNGRAHGPSLRPGVVVGGKFVLLRQIGEGAVGAIFEAEDTWLGRRVALKVLHAHVARHPEVMLRFRREARAAASIDHPNIVDVLEIGQRRDGTFYIVQELLDGCSLRQHIQREGRLPVEETFDILTPIMGALVAAHRKDIVHRDIKPENIILSRAPSGEATPKLIDFGIARMHGQEGELDTASGVLLGTPSYMSPEQASGAPVDAGTDVWAVGAVMYELLAGARPFRATSAALVLEKIRSEAPTRITSVVPELPEAVADIVHGALERDPLLRYPSMLAFQRAVLDFMAPIDPGFFARHARSIPRHVSASWPDFSRPEADVDVALDETERPLAPSVVSVVRPVAPAELEFHEDVPPAPPRALGAYAETALRVNALDDAIALAEQAIAQRRGEPDEQRDDLLGRMRLVQAIANRWLGHFGEAERCAREATTALPRGTPAWYAAFGHLAMAVGHLGKSVVLADLAEELSRMEPAPPAIGAHVRALCQIAIFLIRAGMLALAERLYGIAQAQTAELPHGEPTVHAWVDQAGAEFALHAGDPTAFLRLVESAVEGFAEAGDTRNASLQRANSGNAYMQLGAFQRAERVLRQAIAVAEPMKLSFLAPVKANLGYTLARLGHVEEALAVETDAVERCMEHGYRRFEAASRIYLAEILALRGELHDAEQEAARAEAASSGAPAIRAHALATHASILLATGGAEPALARAREAMSILSSAGGVEEGEALIRLVHIQALMATGYVEEAGERIMEAQARLRDRSAHIGDPRYRKSFLQNVPENAATMALVPPAPARAGSG